MQIFNGSVEKYHSLPESVFVGTSLNLVQYHGHVYSCPIPQEFKNVGSIVHFEATNIALAIQLWYKVWQNKKVILWCDNWAVANAFNNHKIRVIIPMASVRTVCCIQLHTTLNCIHIPRVENTYADILSCWHNYSNLTTPEVEGLRECQWEDVTGSMLSRNFGI